MNSRTPWPRHPAWNVAAVAALLVATTCGCAATPEPNESPAAPPAPAPHVQAALDDAARSTGVAHDKLKVSSVETVTWLDGSLGCPEPELMYTQALVAGYRIRIEAGGKTLDYHADKRGTVVLCPPERSVVPAADPRAPQGE